MTQRLNNPFLVLPKYWFQLSETRQIVAGSLEELYTRCAKADPEGIPADFNIFSEMVIDAMCPELPRGLCSGNSTKVTVFTSFPELKGWINAAKEVVKTGVTGGKLFVDSIEAERRAAICLECPLNKHGGLCLSCTGFNALSTMILSGRKTIYDKKLGACSACKCLLKTKIHLSTEVIDSIDARNSVELGAYDERCWRRTETP